MCSQSASLQNSMYILLDMSVLSVLNFWHWRLGCQTYGSRVFRRTYTMR
jgi:hypothetical protein